MENMNIIATEETLTEALESIDYSTGYVEGSDQDQAEGGRPYFTIDNDEVADWAVRKIAEERSDYERLKELAETQIAKIQEKIEAEKTRAERRPPSSRAAWLSILEPLSIKRPKPRRRTSS